MITINNTAYYTYNNLKLVINFVVYLTRYMKCGIIWIDTRKKKLDEEVVMRIERSVFCV